MPTTYRISRENVEEIRSRMKQCTDKTEYRRMEAVALRGEGKSNEEAGKITRYNPDWVSKLVSLYCNQGIEALAIDRRNGGNHRNLSYKQEQEILEGFHETATAGQIITPGEIKKRYDQVLGRETTPTFIYAVLKRHGWRMVMPRARHPKKADDEVIEASKKLTPAIRNQNRLSPDPVEKSV